MKIEAGAICVEIDDQKIVKMAAAINSLDSSKSWEAFRPKEVRYRNASAGYDYNLSGASKRINDAYCDAVEAASQKAIDDYRARLRAIADGQDVE